MKYELAKQLKDTGFSQDIQEGSFYFSQGKNMEKLYGPFCWGGEGEDKPYGEYILIPTLSELIEACGNQLLALQHTPFTSTMPIPAESMPHEWMAMGGENRETHFSYQQSGFTSEEAVAKLWLALQQR